MFERFTERARHVVMLAQEEARQLEHDAIGTEHLLLGLLREEDGIGATVLRHFGLALEPLRAEVKEAAGVTGPPKEGQLPFTVHAKKVLELALREALGLGHNYIGTEHLLMGFIREDTGAGALILRNRGINPTRVREELLRQLSSSEYRPRRRQEPPAPDENQRAIRAARDACLRASAALNMVAQALDKLDL